MLLNPSVGTDIQRVAIAAGQEYKLETSAPVIAISVKGAFLLQADSQKEGKINGGQLFFLPPGHSYVLTGRGETKLLCLFVPDCLALIRYYFPAGLPVEKTASTSLVRPLPLSPPLWEFYRHIEVLLDGLPLSPILQMVKTCELFCFLKSTYRAGLVARLFSAVLKNEDTFSDFIWKSYPLVKTVEEFARLSGHSLSGFEKRFKEVFGTSPYRWMIERKKERLYEELIHSDDPIQEVADRCGFSSPSRMNDFCKRYMGFTPGTIRRRRK